MIPKYKHDKDNGVYIDENGRYMSIRISPAVKKNKNE